MLDKIAYLILLWFSKVHKTFWSICMESAVEINITYDDY